MRVGVECVRRVSFEYLVFHSSVSLYRVNPIIDDRGSGSRSSFRCNVVFQHLIEVWIGGVWFECFYSARHAKWKLFCTPSSSYGWQTCHSSVSHEDFIRMFVATPGSRRWSRWNVDFLRGPHPLRCLLAHSFLHMKTRSRDFCRSQPSSPPFFLSWSFTIVRMSYN